MDNDFKQALVFTLQYEGGYSNHPNDKGGETNKGITHSVYDSYRVRKGLPKRSVKRIDHSEVEDIYYNEYWLKASCDTLPKALGCSVFDFAVNSGVQRALDYLRVSQGNVDTLNDKRESFFKAISAGKNKVFLKGWLNRLNALRKYVKGL